MREKKKKRKERNFFSFFLVFSIRQESRMFVECLSLPRWRFSPSPECWFYKDRIIRKEYISYISFLFPRELRLIVPFLFSFFSKKSVNRSYT